VTYRYTTFLSGIPLSRNFHHQAILVQTILVLWRNKVPVKVWEALVQSPVRLGGFGVEPGYRFNRLPKKVPEKVQGGFGAEPGQLQQGSGEGRRRFGRLWCRARSSSTGFRRRFHAEKIPGGFGATSGSRGFRRRFQKRFRRGRGGFGAEPGQVQQGSQEGSGEG